MTKGLPARRVLFVHAHPDDESINNGATMARYVAEGAHVTVVTCTLGEEGEVIPAELAHLAPDREDRLGPYRAGELAAAMAELGVTDNRFLGGQGRYRDSGMMGLATNDRPECFWQADLDEAAAHLVAVVREVRPQVLVVYDANGGYGHPDHVQAHRVGVRAAELAADPAFRPDLGPAHRIAKTYANCIPLGAARRGVAELAGALARTPFPAVAEIAELPGVVPEEQVDCVVDGTAHAERKAAAMRAHATQITVDGPYFALSNDRAQPIWYRECYRLLAGTRGPVGPAGHEEDLFAGLTPEAAQPVEAGR
ncbi:N-acetyl-1-D-myo-inositol-2-amino-2-deoxy-alpha-D-glucopyranoside deacetylase [Allostreptomyces psammosilenae]|uniref:1D-myo-inositol 2-acetamido-2-deoxy-alpha-D-glucopyranoside deacetylase n=1 Tax=Allostreptomyces psammosilenae TaxID=1892865 RepID=A0A853AC83_9ACTN|nr:N-acetyl-1-D-myo-inositol-2-amino-2-deoxy-alpha-D-glucopyranoside deacetylase [Allostreptomyces psammosilenae]NYI08078.1 N-acetyl-1-D-myo-inositol-2-amino-2-deoxy-alpha-D-glucopyranoside deacetylase [Allostreptomyces psammosilenae]